MTVEFPNQPDRLPELAQFASDLSSGVAVVLVRVPCEGEHRLGDRQPDPRGDWDRPGRRRVEFGEDSLVLGAALRGAVLSENEVTTLPTGAADCDDCLAGLSVQAVGRNCVLASRHENGPTGFAEVFRRIPVVWPLSPDRPEES